MKKLMIVSFAALLAGFAASAQTDRATAPSSATAAQTKHQHNGEKKEMMKQLNLSKDQRSQMKAAHKEMKAKKAALKAQAGNMSAADMKTQEDAMRAEQKTKTAAILTPDQRAKMAEMKKQKMAAKGNTKVNP